MISRRFNLFHDHAFYIYLLNREERIENSYREYVLHQSEKDAREITRRRFAFQKFEFDLDNVQVEDTGEDKKVSAGSKQDEHKRYYPVYDIVKTYKLIIKFEGNEELLDVRPEDSIGREKAEFIDDERTEEKFIVLKFVCKKHEQKDFDLEKLRLIEHVRINCYEINKEIEAANRDLDRIMDKVFPSVVERDIEKKIDDDFKRKNGIL